MQGLVAIHLKKPQERLEDAERIHGASAQDPRRRTSLVQAQGGQGEVHDLRAIAPEKRAEVNKTQIQQDLLAKGATSAQGLQGRGFVGAVPNGMEPASGLRTQSAYV